MKKFLSVAVAAGAAALVLAPAASADVGLTGKNTTLTLDSGTARALGSLNVDVATTGKAKATKSGIRFPITTKSEIDPASAAGTVYHTGGLRFSGGGKKITLSDYVVKVGKKITLSARVGKARATVIDLTGKPKVTRPGGFNTTVSGLTAKLNSTGAKALNATFGVTAFKKGTKLGKVTVAATTDETELLASGNTALAINPGTLGFLVGAGFTPAVVGPATLAGTTATFPITGGNVKLNLSGGEITHSGGISLAKGGVTVALTNFDIRLGATPQLYASINGGAQKAPILDLNLSSPQVAVSGRKVTVGNVPATLTQAAATALNGAFTTTAFTAGIPLGVATVNAEGK